MEPVFRKTWFPADWELVWAQNLLDQNKHFGLLCEDDDDWIISLCYYRFLLR